jgi:sugar phosphate isomerase/epimerase
MNLERLSIHTMTTKPWPLEQALAKYAAAGVRGITVWRQSLHPFGANMAGRMIQSSGLACTALARGGFFVAPEASARSNAIAENKRAIDEAAQIGAPMLILVCGAVPRLPLSEARKQIADAIAALAPYAEQHRVKLAIEPLHPMYAADRSAINTMRQAREICEAVGSPWVGIALDAYHVWWDPELESEIARCGAGGLLAGFHLSDWRVETRDLLNDRGLMGEGCIPLKRLREWVEAAGFTGFQEVEIFSNQFWSQDQDDFLARIKQAYIEHC